MWLEPVRCKDLDAPNVSSVASLGCGCPWLEHCAEIPAAYSDLFARQVSEYSPGAREARGARDLFWALGSGLRGEGAAQETGEMARASEARLASGRENRDSEPKALRLPSLLRTLD